MLSHNIKSPRGNILSCKGWHQEAAMRMLMNNLDPEVAEQPDELIVYGGRGKAARNQYCRANDNLLHFISSISVALKFNPEKHYFV